MDDENTAEKFLRSAEDAEHQADIALNQEAAEKFRRIAAGYRDLAELAKRGIV